MSQLIFQQFRSPCKQIFGSYAKLCIGNADMIANPKHNMEFPLSSAIKFTSCRKELGHPGVFGSCLGMRLYMRIVCDFNSINLINDKLAMSDPTDERPFTSVELTPIEKDNAGMTLRVLERLDEKLPDETGMWIFGYGSLCWHQGFNFEKSFTGFIRGFSRKFWQGNTTHRGTHKKPGRVATLVEEEEGTVWGQAFLVKEKKAFLYLNNRECELGGYLTAIATFYPRQDAKEDQEMKPFPVILYLATPSNSLWLGDSPLAEIATQIVECAGNSGHNVEYLLRLATFIRENIPEAVDDHLFTLEYLVRSQIKKKNMCLKSLMGEHKIFNTEEREIGERDPGGHNPDFEAVERSHSETFQFTSKVSSEKLHCVNI